MLCSLKGERHIALQRAIRSTLEAQQCRTALIDARVVAGAERPERQRAGRFEPHDMNLVDLRNQLCVINMCVGQTMSYSSRILPCVSAKLDSRLPFTSNSLKKMYKSSRQKKDE
jgi:hypothetical protein